MDASLDEGELALRRREVGSPTVPDQTFVQAQFSRGREVVLVLTEPADDPGEDSMVDWMAGQGRQLRFEVPLHLHRPPRAPPILKAGCAGTFIRSLRPGTPMSRLAILALGLLLMSSALVLFTTPVAASDSDGDGFDDAIDDLPDDPGRWNTSEDFIPPIGLTQVRLETSLGNISLVLFQDILPRTAENFIKLIDAGYYDGTVFHDVTEDFTIQAGAYDDFYAPLPEITETIHLEMHPAFYHTDGALAMLWTTDPHNASTRFFINDGVQRQLDGIYAVFGQVFAGFEVVDAIASVETTNVSGLEHAPKEPILIHRAYILDPGIPFSIIVPDDFLVEMETTMGTIYLEVYGDRAPRTATNFYNYVESGFYDGTIFHRIIDGFMIQGGGFTDVGVRKAPTQPNVTLEIDPTFLHLPGILSMARTGVLDSANSQFFLMDGVTPHLDGEYAAFGLTVRGFEVLQAISAVDTSVQAGYSDVPVSRVGIISARIIDELPELVITDGNGTDGNGTDGNGTDDPGSGTDDPGSGTTTLPVLVLTITQVPDSDPQTYTLQVTDEANSALVTDADLSVLITPDRDLSVTGTAGLSGPDGIWTITLTPETDEGEWQLSFSVNRAGYQGAVEKVVYELEAEESTPFVAMLVPFVVVVGVGAVFLIRRRT